MTTPPSPAPSPPAPSPSTPNKTGTPDLHGREEHEHSSKERAPHPKQGRPD
jgi:hypothetical protein